MFCLANDEREKKILFAANDATPWEIFNSDVPIVKKQQQNVSRFSNVVIVCSLFSSEDQFKCYVSTISLSLSMQFAKKKF